MSQRDGLEGREPAVRKIRCKWVLITQVTGPWIWCSRCGGDVTGAHVCVQVRSHAYIDTRSHPRGPCDPCAMETEGSRDGRPILRCVRRGDTGKLEVPLKARGPLLFTLK